MRGNFIFFIVTSNLLALVCTASVEMQTYGNGEKVDSKADDNKGNANNKVDGNKDTNPYQFEIQKTVHYFRKSEFH